MPWVCGASSGSSRGIARKQEWIPTAAHRYLPFAERTVDSWISGALLAKRHPSKLIAREGCGEERAVSRRAVGALRSRKATRRSLEDPYRMWGSRRGRGRNPTTDPTIPGHPLDRSLPLLGSLPSLKRLTRWTMRPGTGDGMRLRRARGGWDRLGPGE